MSSTDDKANWKLLASSVYPDAVHHGYGFAIDGIRGDTNTFATIEAPHPWFRIDLGKQYWIKGARISIRPLVQSRLKFTEVVWVQKLFIYLFFNKRNVPAEKLLYYRQG